MIETLIEERLKRREGKGCFNNVVREVMIKAVAASCEMAVINGHKVIDTADRFNCNKCPTCNSGICVSTSALNHPILSLFLVYSFTHS